MNVDWTSAAFLIAVVYALTEFIKTLTKGKLGEYARLVAIALGFALVFFAKYAPEIIKFGFIIGVGASGIYDFRNPSK